MFADYIGGEQTPCLIHSLHFRTSIFRFGKAKKQEMVKLPDMDSTTKPVKTAV